MTPLHPGRRLRRLAALAAPLTLVLAGSLLGSAPAVASPRGHDFLLVADPAAEAVYVYRASDRRLTGRLTGLELSGHAGTVRLPDGRVIGVDDQVGRVVEIAIGRSGRATIADSVDLPGEWEGAAWAAVDPGLRWFAVSGGSEEEPTISLVDLRSFEVHQMPVAPEPDTSGETPETQVYLAGRPLQVVYTTGGQFRTVPLRSLLPGRTPTVTSTAPVGPATHGPVVTRNGDAVFSTTAEGLDGAALDGATLGASSSVAYSATRDLVQIYRPRLAADGHSVWGSVAEDTGLAPEQWTDTRNNVGVVDTRGGTSTLLRIPDGVAGRLAISQRYAAVTTIHPEGDVLTLVDARRGSPTYQRVVGTVALPSLSAGPRAGSPTAGTESHATALDPSGDRAYVTQGGDGEVSVVDTRSRRVVATIDIPTPLTSGGYVTVVRPGAPVTDLIAR